MSEIILPDGASLSGMSFWANIARCPRKAKLMESRANFTGAGASRGIVFHSLMEAWLTSAAREPEELADVVLTPDDHSALADMSSVAHARTLAAWFIQHGFQRRRESLGRVLGAELEYRSDTWAERLNVPVLPGETERRPLTARFDLLLEVLDRSMPLWGQLAAGGASIFPGRWVVDYKVLSARRNLASYGYKLAQAWYPLAAEAALGERIEGCVYIFVIATKVPGIEIAVIPRTGEEEDVLRSFFSSVRRKLADGYAPDPYACTDEWGVCPFAGAECSRY